MPWPLGPLQRGNEALATKHPAPGGPPGLSVTHDDGSRCTTVNSSAGPRALYAAPYLTAGSARLGGDSCQSRLAPGGEDSGSRSQWQRPRTQCSAPTAFRPAVATLRGDGCLVGGGWPLRAWLMPQATKSPWWGMCCTVTFWLGSGLLCRVPSSTDSVGPHGLLSCRGDGHSSGRSGA